MSFKICTYLQNVNDPIELVTSFFGGDGALRSTSTSTSIANPSMYPMFTYIWLSFIVNAGRYTSPMDPMGIVQMYNDLGCLWRAVEYVHQLNLDPFRFESSDQKGWMLNKWFGIPQ